MNNLSLYYSSSLLNAYLTENSDSNLELDKPKRENAVPVLITTDEASFVSVPTALLLLSAALGLKNDLGANVLDLDAISEKNPAADRLVVAMLAPGSSKSASARRSVMSAASTYNSLYSSLTDDLADLDLESVKLPFEEMSLEQPKTSRLKRMKQFLTGEQHRPKVMDENDKYIAYVDAKMRTDYYSCENSATLDVNFVEAAEVLFFGETLSKLFASEQSMLHYLMLSSYELGEVRFSNLNRFHVEASYDVQKLLMDLQPQLATFNDILDLYAVSDENINRQELFETFSQFANEAHGLCIPLAISMFGNWLLTFNRDSALESNYQNDLILDYFRKSIRLALVIRRLAPFFDAHLQQLSKKDRLDVTRYWKKDNTNALSTSLHSLGEYHQFIHEHDKAVTIWEINCHLTEDAELGHLAVLGLTNGYGFGNLAKKQNRFGHHSKKHRYNTKRRIAHIYRILMKKPGFDEFGVSWATKEKYD